MKLMPNRQDLKYALRKATGCDMQHNGWPCGTCFFSISKTLTNKDWQALLHFRGDYAISDLDNYPVNPNRHLSKIFKLVAK